MVTPRDLHRSRECPMRSTVLVVDDERDFVDPLAERLAARDFSVQTAYSGDEALARVSVADVDVVILDVLMPGKDGIRTLREIKERKPLVEVIMLTGQAMVKTAIEGMKRGAYDYLMKPTELVDLIDKIDKATRRKRAHEERIRNAEKARTGLGSA
jgi:two-component system, OmpR family, response regulator CpxR